MSIEDTMHYRYVNYSFIIPVMYISVKHVVALFASYKLYACPHSSQPAEFLTPIGYDIGGNSHHEWTIYSTFCKDHLTLGPLQGAYSRTHSNHPLPSMNHQLPGGNQYSVKAYYQF